ncbi:FAD-binding oxidoreductase [Methylocapsa sp. S129]|uniref:FAD-binding oxidoreductase n=1 Tax=Methylocapsa sp. S129 TaxID=1641869 RepID=UPI001FEE09AC|nr:FAD-binding oxidoreductase [Methylocapsa sp. S129]
MSAPEETERGALAAPVAALIADIGDVPFITDRTTVRRRSRDFFWYSPILNEQLTGKSADLVVTPRNEEDVIRIARACARHNVPLTPRGGGTGNYGQAVPLHGGVLIDFSAMTKILWSKPGVLRVESGAKMHDIDAALRPSGWELRMHPSTKRSATIGGFVAGGSGGVGSITYGGLREPGNILAARIVTLEREPRVVELRGDAAQKINRAYGSTGLITELEMPLAPAWDWVDVIVAFDDFIEAVEVGCQIALSDGIVKKLLTPITWPIPTDFRELGAACPEGKSLLIAMIAEPSLEAFRVALAGRGATTYEAPSREGPGETPLYEYCWNHTTLHMLKRDRGVTYLQCLFPHDRLLPLVKQMVATFGDEVLHHLEFSRYAGHVTASALPIVRYKSPERLYEIIAAYEAAGVMIANPHVYTLEDGSRYRRADADQLGFKAEVDPYGLLNPGKMRSFVPAKWEPAP